MSAQSVCIIGAGSSGIAAAKVLKQRGIPFQCFEAGGRVGGNWVYGNENGMSSAYESLHINTSKPRMEYSDFPMPAEHPDFPHHSQIADYFANYAQHFGICPHIRFHTKVESAEPVDGGGWLIRASDGSAEKYEYLMVANGHHWDERWPDPAFPGHFDGPVIHSHAYKTPAPYAGKRVLIVGFGNSAVDIAVETSRIAQTTILSVRRGFHVIPKHIFGKPLDQQPLPAFLPFEVQRKILQVLIRLQMGKMTDFHLPAPDHKLLHAHPTISSEFLNRIAHGRIMPKPNIQRLDGNTVEFTDGTREPVDAIIYATGYRVTFPFFRREVIAAENNDLPLFRRVFHPAYEDLFFIGLLQPLGAIMPLAELQSEWVARYIQGRMWIAPAYGDGTGDLRGAGSNEAALRQRSASHNAGGLPALRRQRTKRVEAWC